MERALLNLNKAQRQAVLHDQGPVLVVAGAGTGKTTVIASRFLYLINKKKAKPEEILALTFTDKAAGEMEERIEQGLPLGHTDLWVGTFHSFCQRLLEEHGLDIGLPGSFKVLDNTRAWLLVRRSLENFDLDYYRPLGNPTRFIHALLEHFSRCKDEAIYPEDYLGYADSLKKSLNQNDEDKRIRELAKAYASYQNLLLDNSLLDFGDLINYTVKLLKERPSILKKYRGLFRYIMVDEFQDTNYIQYELIKLLTFPKNNFLASADDDQAIYRWRGASFNNVLRFITDFPKAKRIVLKENYRSGQNILDLAYEFIQKNNPNRLECRLQESQEIRRSAREKGLNIENFQSFDKKLVAHNKDRADIDYLHFRTLEEEAEGVAQKIISLYDGSWNDFSILSRANSQAVPFMRALERANVPYQFLSSRGLYAKSVILDLVSFLKLLDNYHENMAMFRVLNFPIFDFSLKEIANLNQVSRRKAISLFQTLEKTPTKKVRKLLDTIEKYTKLSKEKRVGEVVISFVNDSDFLKLKTPEEIRLLNQFLYKIKAFEEEEIDPSLNQFMAQLKLELESGDEGKLEFDPNEGPDMVKIMTVHGAKGLEFRYVFIVNLVAQRFPTLRRGEPIQLPEPLIKEVLPEGDWHLPDERRLFYVAMTRAKEGLYLTSALHYGGVRSKKPSLFLKEIGFSGAEILKLNTRPKNLQVKAKKIDFEFTKNKVLAKQGSYFELPKQFSFSQLSLYSFCPYQYYLTYILRLPQLGSAALSFGQTMHNTLYQFVKLSAGQRDLFSSDKKTLSFKSLLEIYKEAWIDDWFFSKEQKERYRDEGRKALKLFFEKFQRLRPRVLELEKSFKFPLRSYLISGRIDRIDEDKLIDYKTGAPKEKLEVEDKLQLLVYQIASEEVFLVKPKKLVYYYLNNGQEVEFLGTEKEIAKAKLTMLSRIKEIKKGNFDCRCGKCQVIE